MDRPTRTQENPMPAPDALTTCNACEVNPMLPDSAAGYCADCDGEARAQTCRGFRAMSDTLPCENCGATYAAHGRPLTEVARDYVAAIDAHRERQAAEMRSPDDEPDDGLDEAER